MSDKKKELKEKNGKEKKAREEKAYVIYAIDEIGSDEGPLFVDVCGQTSAQRMTYHRSKARQKDQLPIHEYMASCVEKFRCRALETLLTNDLALVQQRKEYWIDKYKPRLNQEKIKIQRTLTCYCGQTIIGESAMKRHLQMGRHWKRLDDEPVLSIRLLFPES